MGCGANFSKLPSLKARSIGWMEASCSFPLWNKKEFNRHQKIVVQSTETLMVLWSAVWHWERLQLRHDCVLLNSRPLEPSLGLVRTTQQTQSRMHGIHNFQRGGPEKFIGTIDPRHALQENGGVGECWYRAWTQLLLTGKSVKHAWPPSTQQSGEMLHSESGSADRICPPS